MDAGGGRLERFTRVLTATVAMEAPQPRRPRRVRKRR